MTQGILEFQKAMAEHGLYCNEIIADAGIRRFHIEGGSPGNVDGWYTYHSNGIPAGAYGSWKTGDQFTWCGRNFSTLTPTERAEHKRIIEKAKAQQEAERNRQAETARQTAKKIWDEATPAEDDHLYLLKKKFSPYGIKSANGKLLIPLHDNSEILHSLQFIDDTGNKMFLKGGSVTGHYHLIGQPNGKIFLSEGYATAATIHEATGEAVAVAFNAGNLLPVGKAIKEKHQDVQIIIAGDNDQWTDGNPGKTKAEAAGKELSAMVALPKFKDTSKKPTDYNDLMKLEGLSVVRNQLTVATLEARDEMRAHSNNGDTEKKTQSALLVELVKEQNVELWHDPDGKAYATITIDGHEENWSLNCRGFKDCLSRLFYKKYNKTPNSQAMQDALCVLSGQARFDGAEHEPHIRIAGNDETIYIDLANEKWHVIEITTNDWQILDKSPVKFIRKNGMRLLPEPKRGESLNALWRFINIKDEDDRKLYIVWLLAVFKESGPYPVLVNQGEQGSGKSVTSRVSRALADPSKTPIRSIPRSEHDLLIAAGNSRLIALDNLSGVQPWLSDAICRLSTGGGFATRQLYSDDEEVLIDVQRPVVINGIDDLAVRQDLVDRAIIITQPTIPDDQRIPESEFWKEFETARPGILSAILVVVSGILKTLPTIKLGILPRMADFAVWGVATEKVLNWEPGSFMTAYMQNRQHAVESGLDASVVAQSVREFMEKRNHWEGTATELLEALPASDQTARSKAWPKVPRTLSNQLRRLAPALRKVGIQVTFARRKKNLILLDILRNLPTSSTLSTAPTKTMAEMTVANVAGVAKKPGQSNEIGPDNRELFDL